MDQALPLVFKGAPIIAQHYDKVTDPARYHYQRMRGRITPPDPDLVSNRNYEDKGYVLRKRSEVQSDEEIVEVVRHRGQRLPRRPGMARRSSSMDDLRDRQALVPYNKNRELQAPRRSRTDIDGGRRRGAAGGDGWSDSEGSVPPRSRNGRSRAQSRSKSVNGAGANGRSKSKSKSKSGGKRSSSRSSSSSVCSSTEDEKKIKKAVRKKWITAGLAGVATVHAASKVYSSIESHDKRMIDVQQGTLSPEDAHKKARSHRWQDAAAIAIAALGIKGAISEWNETMEEHHEHQQLMQEKEEHHKQRLEHERRKKARDAGGYYKGRDGNWYYDGQEVQGYGRSKSRGPERGRGVSAKRNSD